jgi:hypothetical protein
MYKNPVLLSSENHRQLKVASVRDFGFSRNLNSCAILCPEYFVAGRFYPLVFSRSGETLLSVAVLGLQGNLFVNDAGQWEQGAYIPAFLRRYPYLTNDTSEAAPVYIDAACEGFDAANGERLFTDEGQRTPLFQEVLKFLQEYHLQAIATGQFLARLEELKLLRAVEAKLKPPGGGKELTLKDMLMVDEKALYALPDEELAALARKGYLALIYAHLQSLPSMNGIVMRQQRATTPPPGPEN